MALLSLKSILTGAGLDLANHALRNPLLLSQSLLRAFTTTTCLNHQWAKHHGPKIWPRLNTQVFLPTPIGETTRPAFVCHMKLNIKYSPLKLWYVACLVRGMTIDEAVRQLEYVKRKGAAFVIETLLEAQEMAVQQHNVEFRSNLWVAESFSGKGIVVKGMRRHAKKRMGEITYRYSHYFVRLEEGTPPKDYYRPEPDGPTLLQEYIQGRRDLRIFGTL